MDKRIEDIISGRADEEKSEEETGVIVRKFHPDDVLVKAARLFGHEELLPESGDRSTTWRTFLQRLDELDLMAKAFESAWSSTKTSVGAVGKYGLPYQDAQDVVQEAMLSAWMAFKRYRPWLSSWSTWVYRITDSRAKDFLRKLYSRPREVDLSIAVSMEVETDKMGWSIPIVAAKWMIEGHLQRAMFAKMLLEIYDGYDWPQPTSQEASNIIGMSRTTLWTWLQEFIKEVVEYEIES